MVVLAEDLRARLQEPALRAEVERSLGGLLQQINAQLVGHEQLRMLVIARDPWSIENGCLTPTMKIKRSRIEGQVGDRLEAWYGQPGPVVWA